MDCAAVGSSVAVLGERHRRAGEDQGSDGHYEAAAERQRRRTLNVVVTTAQPRAQRTTEKHQEQRAVRQQDRARDLLGVVGDVEVEDPLAAFAGVGRFTREDQARDQERHRHETREWGECRTLR